MRLDPLFSVGEVKPLQGLVWPVDPSEEVGCLGSLRLDPFPPIDAYEEGKLLGSSKLVDTSSREGSSSHKHYTHLLVILQER